MKFHCPTDRRHPDELYFCGDTAVGHMFVFIVSEKVLYVKSKLKEQAAKRIASFRFTLEER